MLNLTIAVILEGFSLSHEDDEPLFEPELLEEFQTKWADIDPKATGFVKVDKMLLLVNLLKPPLGKFGLPFHMAHFFKYMCKCCCDRVPSGIPHANYSLPVLQASSSYHCTRKNTSTSGTCCSP